MSMGGRGGPGIKAEINVTPLVDVCLVLLIIFMVVTPLLQRGKAVHLPTAAAIDKEKKRGADPLVVSITLDKKLYLEQDAVAEAALEQGLRAKLSASPGKTILLKGDEGLSFGDVRKVMNVARRAGAKGVALGVEELKPK
jgi:biopolymer transport protein ExbD/biopolymer transport protein TolR